MRKHAKIGGGVIRGCVRTGPRWLIVEPRGLAGRIGSSAAGSQFWTLHPARVRTLSRAMSWRGHYQRRDALRWVRAYLATSIGRSVHLPQVSADGDAALARAVARRWRSDHDQTNHDNPTADPVAAQRHRLSRRASSARSRCGTSCSSSRPVNCPGSPPVSRRPRRHQRGLAPPLHNAGGGMLIPEDQGMRCVTRR